eukprot:230834_1
MTSSSKAHNADSLSLATRYSLLRGRHLSMQKYWNERHCNDKKYIEQLEDRNTALLEMLQIAQNEINNLKIQKASNKEDLEETELLDKAQTQAQAAQTQTPMWRQTRALDLEGEYKKVLKQKANKSMERERLFYEVLRECLFLSDPYNMRVLLKRSKHSKNEEYIPLQSAVATILKLRKQIDYECDCFAIHYGLNSHSHATRIILMRNSLIICGVGVSNKHESLNTMQNIDIELYTIAGIYIGNNDPYSYCNSMMIACSKDLTVAAHGINPLLHHPNVMRYEFNIFSDSKQLIHSLTERLPDYVWHINKSKHQASARNMSSSYETKHDDIDDTSASMVGRLGAGLYAGITGVVMDPIRGGQNDGMKGFLRGIASGISGVAIKPITHFRSNSVGIDDVLSPPMVEQEGENRIKSALAIPDSPLVFQAESVSESESITSSTITSNTLDSSRSGQSTNLNHTQSPLFTKHKLIQRQQYLSTIDDDKTTK